MAQQQTPERESLEHLAASYILELRRARRWGIFFRVVTLLILVFLILVILGWIGRAGTRGIGEHTALVQLNGEISADSPASADRIIKALDNAFEDPNSKGVILRINSPGGSPVQAGEINDEMWRLRKKYPKKPLYVVVDDMCASGGYYVAVAADKIFVNKASLVGSIGVLMDGFGFTGIMKKVGVERRLLTAGSHKGFLDPFSPMKPDEKAYAEKMLEQVHQQFIQAVRKGRGTRLHETPEMFSGLVWSGASAVKLGLADGFGSVDSVARNVIGAPSIVDYTQQQGLVERIADRIGTSFGQSFGTQFIKSWISPLTQSSMHFN
ncbi:MAG TPA: signal peptide peptidase SppA [Burkholderiales bacterium]|nr:signal peptide peptidase SppA [Burkholderiales bacterium]